MPEDRSSELTLEFDHAFRNLAAARAAYEDQPRDPERIAALGAARVLLDEARTTMEDERRRLGLKPPWRVAATPVADGLVPPPLWSVDHGPES